MEGRGVVGHLRYSRAPRTDRRRGHNLRRAPDIIYDLLGQNLAVLGPLPSWENPTKSAFDQFAPSEEGKRDVEGSKGPTQGTPEGRRDRPSMTRYLSVDLLAQIENFLGNFFLTLH